MPMQALAELSSNAGAGAGGAFTDEAIAGLYRTAGRMGGRVGLAGRRSTAIGRGTAVGWADSHPSGPRRSGFN